MVAEMAPGAMCDPLQAKTWLRRSEVGGVTFHLELGLATKMPQTHNAPQLINSSLAGVLTFGDDRSNLEKFQRQFCPCLTLCPMLIPPGA